MADAIIYDTYAIAAALHKLERDREQARKESSYILLDPDESLSSFAIRVVKEPWFRDELWHESDANFADADFMMNGRVTVRRGLEHLRGLHMVSRWAKQPFTKDQQDNLIRVMARLSVRKLIPQKLD